MRQGDGTFTLRSRPRRWLAALVAVTATAGCGEVPAESAPNAAPLPRHWYGAFGEPAVDAWLASGVEPAVTNAAVAAPLPAPLPSDNVERDVAMTPANAVVDERPLSRRHPEAVPQPVPLPAVPVPPPPPVDGAPTGAIVSERAAARIRRGYELAERGAYFAARREFVAALRMIAEAKDEIHGAARRTTALANGLRALEEAENFSPRGRDAAAELSMSVIVSSHRTPAAKQLPLGSMLPQQIADAYYRYAQTQLGAAVAGEPAGSMALHALGKLITRLGRVEPDKNPQADREALALQNAALLARDDNHYAAHELAVLLAESGHFADSDRLLRQVVSNAPDAVVFRNLARVERQLGRPDLAERSERQSQLLASRGATTSANVAWVSADALARTPDPLGPATSGAQQSAPRMAHGPALLRR